MDIAEYSKYKQFYTMDISKLLLKYIFKFPWVTFLDLGCGDGALLYALNKEGLFKNKDIYAIDLAQERIACIKKINENFKCLVNSADDLKNVSDNFIDFIVSTQVIEHVPNDEGMIKEIGRVLKKGNNIVYISTVFKKWYGWYFYRCNGVWTLDPTHLREYKNDNQLFDKLKKNNFEIIESRKTLIWFSMVYFVLRKIKHQGNLIDNRYLKILSYLKVPIPGYYNWEIVCRKI